MPSVTAVRGMLKTDTLRLLRDRFLVGTSRLGSRWIFRPAFSNWRTRPEDIDEFIEVVCTLGQQLGG